MFTIEELKQMLNKDFKHKNRLPLAETYRKNYEKVIVHTRQASPYPILKDYRIMESEKMLSRRIALYEAITAYIYEDATRNLNSALDYKLVSIDAEDKTKELMNKLDFWSFLYDEMIPTMIDDPNAFLVVVPTIVLNEIQADFWLINSFDVHSKTSEYIIFIREGFFYFYCKDFIVRFYLDEENNIVFCDEPSKPYYYFYSFGESPLDYVPAKTLKGIITRTEANKKYYKSYFAASFAHANKAVKMDSDWIVELMTTNSAKILKTKPCTAQGCSDGKVFYEGEETTCNSCHGKGIETFEWNINDIYTVKSEGDDFLDEINLDQIIKFINPPTEYIELRHKYTDDSLSKAEKALNQVDIYMNQSGTAKDLDLKGRDALINTIGENVFGLVQFAFQSVQDFRTIANKRTQVQITIPSDFRATTVDALLLQVENLKAKNMSSGLIYPILRRLYNMMYSKDAISRRNSILQLDYDKLSIYNSVAEKKMASDTMYSFEFSLQLPSALARLAKSLGKEIYLSLSDDEIISRAKDIMDLPSQTQITNENGIII